MREERFNEKLCNITDASTAASLSEHSLVTCGKCGATADDPANVCDPVQLSYPGP